MIYNNKNRIKVSYCVKRWVLKWTVECTGGQWRKARIRCALAFYYPGLQVLNWLHFGSICHLDSCILHLFAFFDALTLRARSSSDWQRNLPITCFTLKNRGTEHHSGTSHNCATSVGSGNVTGFPPNMDDRLKISPFLKWYTEFLKTAVFICMHDMTFMFCCFSLIK